MSDLKTESQLEKEIADKKKELEALKLKNKNSARGRAIKELEEFTDEEKIKAFDSLYSHAALDLKEAVKGVEVAEHWAWEAQMNLLARDRQLFWDYYNSLNS